MTVGPDRRPVIDRIAAKSIEDDNGCYMWTGSLLRGYGQISEGTVNMGDRKTWLVHLYVWEYYFGPKTPGMDLDHICHNEDSTCLGGPTCRHRACWNPDHLEEVTRRENAQRGVKYHPPTCKHGHPYPENAIVRPNGHWHCRKCQNIQQQKRRGHG